MRERFNAVLETGGVIEQLINHYTMIYLRNS
jgi:hypothetical protein